MINVQVSLFGQLTDIAGSDTVRVGHVSSTDELVQAVARLYPTMAGIPYLVAVDKKIIRNNTLLQETSSIALLPPFSGG